MRFVTNECTRVGAAPVERERSRRMKSRRRRGQRLPRQVSPIQSPPSSRHVLCPEKSQSLLAPAPVWQSPRTLGRTYSRVHHDKGRMYSRVHGHWCSHHGLYSTKCQAHIQSSRTLPGQGILYIAKIENRVRPTRVWRTLECVLP